MRVLVVDDEPAARAKLRRLLAALLSRQVALWRHVTLLPRLTPLFSGLRWLHIPLAVLFALTALLHVGISLRQIGW